MVHFYLLLLLLLLPFGANGADDRGCLPVYYEGRICSLDSYAMHWMNEVYHRQTLLPEHRQMFSSPQKSPLDFLWALHGSPDLAYEEVPLFWVGEKGLKSLLQLDESLSRFTFRDLRRTFEDVVAINLKVIEQMILSSFFKVTQGATFSAGQKVHLQIINADIECLVFEHKLLVTSAPSRIPWHFLAAMCHNSPYTILLPNSSSLPLASSLYALMVHFLQFKEALLSHSLLNTMFVSPFSGEFVDGSSPCIGELSSLYNAIFSPGHSYFSWTLPAFFNHYQSAVKQGLLSYPSLFQLKAERIFVKFPILKCCFACYGLSALLFLIFLRKSSSVILGAAWGLMGIGFLLHGGAFLFKSIVLIYPPVSALHDLALFVGWLCMFIGIVFYRIFKKKYLICGALICTEVLFFFLNVLDAREPVFHAGYWLVVHAAMVMSGYAILLLGGILGHFSLVQLLKDKRDVSATRSIVHCVYLGIFLLVIGTYLGAIWADSSWGRLWDWEAKESFAFITICFYLILIHLNHFKFVGPFATALGASLGMVLLSLIWCVMHSEMRLCLVWMGIELLFFGGVWMWGRRSILSRS